MNIANRKDVREFEQKPLPDLPDSTYEAVARSATKFPNRVALKFSCRALSSDIRQSGHTKKYSKKLMPQPICSVI